MKIENRFTKEIIFEDDSQKIVDTVLNAIKNKTYLSEADLSRANLSGADLSISSILHCVNWSEVTDILCLELMRRDAIICGIDRMEAWTKGGQCPFSGNIKRDYYFTEKKSVWKRGKPKMNDMELFLALCKEKNIKL